MATQAPAKETKVEIKKGAKPIDIFRAKHPEILQEIMPHLVEDGHYNKAIIVKELATMMLAMPDEICVVVAYQDRELVGYTIGWIPVDRKFVWLGQSWNTVDRKFGQRAIATVKQWAIDEHDIHEIRFETERNGFALAKKWEFEVHGYIMGCNF